MPVSISKEWVTHGNLNQACEMYWLSGATEILPIARERRAQH